MKLFEKAVLKLTIIYVCILFIIVILFSSTLYSVALRNMQKHSVHPNNIINKDIYLMMQKRDQEIKNGILSEILMIDGIVLLTGGLACYFLSKQTLKPIDEVLEREKRFIADASHELRTPLTSILLENETLLKSSKLKKEELIEQIQSNLEEMQKLKKLSNSLLEFNGSISVKKEEFDLKVIMETLTKNFETSLQNKKINLNIQTTSLMVKTDADCLTKIINIMLDNAIKYSFEGGQITIQTQGENIKIIDEGRGVRVEEVPYLFERFYRSDDVRSIEGNGLGLALAKELAIKIDVSLQAIKNEEKGMTFIINLKNILIKKSDC